MKDAKTCPWQDDVRRAAYGIRRRVLEHTIKNKGGYLSQACSSAELIATLYLKIMNLGPVDEPIIPAAFPGVPGHGNKNAITGAMYNGPRSPEYDRFFLSPAQYALVLYAALIEVSRMAPSGLADFNRDGSTVEMIGAEHSPGMEVMTGSLGQGLSQAAGVAMARKLRRETGRVWVFMSDGELQSGQNWEAFQAISHHHLDNIGVFVDVNGQQCDGPMCDVMNIDPLEKRLESFGTRVFRVDGHNPEILAGLGSLKPDGRPLVVLADTDPVRGLEILEARRPKLHYIRFSSEEERQRYAAVLAQMPEVKG